MNKFFFLLLFLALVTTSCKTPAPPPEGSRPTKRSAKFLLRQLDKQRLDYEWFGCRAKIKVDSEERDVVFSASFRMQKDSLIWVRIRKMNVEGARIKITPKSIEVLDRQKGQYLKRPFSFIKEEYGLDINFGQLQEILLGNPILYQDKALSSSISRNRLLLKTVPNQKQVLKLFLRGNDFLLDELRGSVEGSSLTINYHEYETIKQQKIAAKKVVYIDSKDMGVVEIDLKFSGMVLNEVQKVGFVVPSSYERI